tara:strand:- start:268 stop:1812 length:1545 start_codon:yes stop_codon:yes gene_type:complete
VPLRPFGKSVVWAPTGPEASAFDKLAIFEMEVPERSLMESAGRSAAQLLEKLFPTGEVTVVVGSGNNGGDGLILARTLQSWGRETKVVGVGEHLLDSRLGNGWPMEIGGTETFSSSPSLIVDAILGTGMVGKPRKEQSKAIQSINRSECPVLSLDVPSGLNSDNGKALGEIISADVTIAFGWPKLGTLLQEGRGQVGRLIAIEIGLPPPGPASFGATVVTPGWALGAKPIRRYDSHKNSVGSLLLVAGQAGMAGAAVLSAKGALRGGLGQLRIISDKGNRAVIQSAVPEAIFISFDDYEAIKYAISKSDALAIGPGLGCSSQVGSLLKMLCECEDNPPVLLDADGLNLATDGNGPTIKDWTFERNVLLTPHLGEMARLSSLSPEFIESDRIVVTREFAEKNGATVLLKGLPSVVVPPLGTVLVDSMASSDLASAGMGDLLTGFIGALLAQGLQCDVAGALGLYMIGRAAARTELGPCLVPTDILPELPEVWKEQSDGENNLGLPFVIFDQDAPR